MAEGSLPPERDVKDFKFQQLCKVRVTDTPSALPRNRASLIVSSSKYGLTFLAVQKGFKVFRTSDVVVFDQQHASDRLKHIITDLPVLANVNVGYEVTNLGLSADELTLAVAITRPEHAVVYLYDVRNFATQVTGAVSAFHMIVGEGSKPLNDLAWNPVDPNLLLICYCSGRLDIYSGEVRKASLSSARAKCVCWSPKGKQLVVGRDDGTLVQYDPDLNEKRKWDSPSILTAASEAFDLVWLSTYSFLVAYIPQGADTSEQPSLVLINGSKDGPATCDCFEDISFGSGEERDRKYYFNFIQKWEMIVAGSSNAAEIGVVGKHLDNKQVWERWNLDDSSRAECPLTEDYVDTYPMGLTVDFSSQVPIPLGEDKTHPASPILLILSTEGLIIPYHMMYMHQSAPVLTAPVQTLDTSGLRKTAGVPASSTTQPGIVKNLFGSATTQPALKPAASSSGFAFTAASLGGSTTKSGAPAGFSFTGGSGVPASTDTGAIPKSGANLSLAGSTLQTTPATGFSFTSSFGAPASTNSNQSETKPAGFGSTPFIATNKSGANAGFSLTASFGTPATTGGSLTFQGSTGGTEGFPAKTSVATDAVPISQPAASAATFNFVTKTPETTSQTSGFPFAAKETNTNTANSQSTGFGFAAKGMDSTSSGFSFKPTTTTKTPTPVFGQSTQSAGSTSIFGQSTQSAGSTPAFGQSTQSAGSTPTFGQSAQSAGSTSIFGQSTQSAGSTPAFGQSTQSAGSTSIFGQSTQSAGSTPAFGQSTQSAGSTPTFGQSAQSAGSTSIFGQSTQSAVSTPTFGQSTQSAGSTFGQSTQNAASMSIFGQSTQSAGSTPTFGQSTQSAGSTFGQSTQNAASTSIFGQSAQKTTAVTSTTSATLPAFGKPAAASSVGASGFGATTTGVSKPVPTAGIPVSTLAGQSSAFSGITSAPGVKPLHKSESQPSDLEQSGTVNAPKSPTEPPPPAYPASRNNAPSPQFAPPPQYPSDQSQQESGDTTDAVDKQFSKSILDEVEHFSMELAEFRSKASNINYEVGTRHDMELLKKQTQEMDTFCSDIKATVQEQNKEVQDQRALCLDMFSMVEECRMRQDMSTDPKYIHLLKSRALDPGSAEKLQQLQLQYQVLDQGLRDVDLILDTQWEEYQNRKKNRTNRVQNPTNDAVYRVVKSNHSLIQAQKSKLKELEERLKQLKLYNQTSAWNNTSSTFRSTDTTTELSNLADTLLSESPVKSRSDSLTKEEKLVSRNRLERLRKHLCRRNVSVIRSTKPGNLSALKIPDSQLESSLFRNSQPQLSDLAGAPRSAGEFVGMFRRTSPAPSTSASSTNVRATAPQSNKQIVEAQNEKNKQVKEKADKDGKMTGFFKKIIEKGEEKVGNFFSPKSRAPPTVTTSQGLGVKPPAQQTTIPKTVQTEMVESKHGGQSQQSTLKVKEINGIRFEDITPSGSENDIDETEEDDEYDEDSSGSNGGEGFGVQYNMPSTIHKGTTHNTTPVTVKAPSVSSSLDGVKLPSSVTTSTPVGRKLFTSEETKPSFTFGESSAGSSSIKFGTDTAAAESKTKPAVVSKPLTFTTSAAPTFGSQSETRKPQTGFNFSMAGTPSFGVKSETQPGTTSSAKKPEESTGKPAASPVTGLFGKPLTADSRTSESNPEPAVTTASKPPFLFGQSSSTGPTRSFTAPASLVSTPGIFGQPKQSVIGQPSDAVEETEDSGETTSQTDLSKPSTSGDTGPSQSTTSSTSVSVSDGQPSSSSAAAGIFGQKAGSSLFGKPESVATSGTATSGSSFFGQGSTATSGTGLFGQTATNTSGASPFGQTTTTASGASPFGQTTTTASGASPFGQTTTTSGASPFGQTTTTSGASPFGQTTTTASGASPFGQTTTTSGASPFGQTTTSGASPFGQTTSTTSVASPFGQTTSTTSGASPFGQTTTTTSSVSGNGLFGQKTTASGGFFGQSSATTSGGGLFGQTPSSGGTTTSSSGGLFGQSAASSSGGLFGQPGGSLFGQTSTSGSGGLFGTPSSSSGGGLFGQTATISSSGLFGQPATTSSSGLFSQPATTSSSGLFGQPATTSSSGLFGQPATTSSSGLFGQPATTSSSGLFGQASSSSGSGLFGSASGSGFGTATSGSGFGFGQTASPGFAKPAFGQPGFGQAQSSGSPFSQSGSDAGGGGGLLSGLGGKPSAEKANTNVFGAGQPFGSSQSSTQGLFGSGTSQTFGTGTSSNGAFSSGGTFSTGAGVGATGFGGAKQQTSGFGGAPSFGSGPSFGGTTGFGSAAAFGSPPAFGSGSTTGGFGSAPAFGSPGAATFGSVSQGAESGGFAGFAGGGSPTFGALAQSTETPTFGALSQSPNPGGFGGNTGNTFGSSPSFTGYRG